MPLDHNLLQLFILLIKTGNKVVHTDVLFHCANCIPKQPLAMINGALHLACALDWIHWQRYSYTNLIIR